MTYSYIHWFSVETSDIPRTMWYEIYSNLDREMKIIFSINVDKIKFSFGNAWMFTNYNKKPEEGRSSRNVVMIINEIRTPVIVNQYVISIHSGNNQLMTIRKQLGLRWNTILQHWEFKEKKILGQDIGNRYYSQSWFYLFKKTKN